MKDNSIDSLLTMNKDTSVGICEPKNRIPCLSGLSFYTNSESRFQGCPSVAFAKFENLPRTILLEIDSMDIIFTLQYTTCQVSQIESVSSRRLAVSNIQTCQNLNMLAVNQLVIAVSEVGVKRTHLWMFSLASRMLVAFSKAELSKVKYSF